MVLDGLQNLFFFLFGINANVFESIVHQIRRYFPLDKSIIAAIQIFNWLGSFNGQLLRNYHLFFASVSFGDKTKYSINCFERWFYRIIRGHLNDQLSFSAF